MLFHHPTCHHPRHVKLRIIIKLAVDREDLSTFFLNRQPVIVVVLVVLVIVMVLVVEVFLVRAFRAARGGGGCGGRGRSVSGGSG